MVSDLLVYDLMNVIYALIGVLVGGVCGLIPMLITGSARDLPGLPKIGLDRWDGLFVVGLMAAVIGAVMVNPWLVLVLFGSLAMVVGVVKGR